MPSGWFDSFSGGATIEVAPWRARQCCKTQLLGTVASACLMLTCPQAFAQSAGGNGGGTYLEGTTTVQNGGAGGAQGLKGGDAEGNYPGGTYLAGGGGNGADYPPTPPGPNSPPPPTGAGTIDPNGFGTGGSGGEGGATRFNGPITSFSPTTTYGLDTNGTSGDAGNPGNYDASSNENVELGGGGGGGGGYGAVVSGTGAFNTVVQIQGGTGGAGGDAVINNTPQGYGSGYFAGGNGGVGGVGISFGPGAMFTVAPSTDGSTTGSVTGGSGGNGGNATLANYGYGTGAIGFGGLGGTGAAGIVAAGPGTDGAVAVTVVNGSTVTGGSGGAGGYGYGSGGAGGAGGLGVQLLGGASLANNGTVTGGGGGTGGYGVIQLGTAGHSTGNFVGGNGGLGADGVSVAAGGTVTVGSTAEGNIIGLVNGGAGGEGGYVDLSNGSSPAAYGYGGQGGAGGNGILVLGPASSTDPTVDSVLIAGSSSVRGGRGGDGGSADGIVDGSAAAYGFGFGGSGGAGGIGVNLQAGASVTDLGTILGGGGGAGGDAPILTQNTDGVGTFVGGDGGLGATGISMAQGSRLSVGTTASGGDSYGTITGGSGGQGGSVPLPGAGSGADVTAYGGMGGDGAAGIMVLGPASATNPSVVAVTISSLSIITGGDGGNGGFAAYGLGYGGMGGAGGTGITMLNGPSVVNAGTVRGGTGGTGGDAGTAYQSSSDSLAGNGGTGGFGIYVTSGGTVTNSGGTISGGSGGEGGAVGNGSSVGVPSSGGNGGDGIFLLDGGTVMNTGGTIQGGVGGAAGSADTPNGTSYGAVGTGGAGVNVFTSGTITNTGSIGGGVGGTGTDTSNGGTGGIGITGTQITIDNFGEIAGGMGGLPADAPGAGGAAISASSSTIRNEVGATISGGSYGVESRSGNFRNAVAMLPVEVPGGVGIIGSNLVITNAGTIEAGASGSGVALALLPPAIQFTGGANTLTLEAGWSIPGNVDAFKQSNGQTGDTFQLGGDTTPSTAFDVSSIVSYGTTAAYADATQTTLKAQFEAFGVFQKVGASTWTLTNTTDYVTPWQILAGTLAITNDNNLGNPAGGVLLGGGTLETLANVTSSRTFTLGSSGGGISTDSGSTFEITSAGLLTDTGYGGLFTKSGGGILLLDGDNTYTGGTHVTGGEVEIVTAGGVGSGAVALDPGTTLGFGNGVSFTNAIGLNGPGGSTLDTNAYTVTVSGGVSGAGGLIKAGTGVLVLPTDNTYSGGTHIAGGEIEIATAGGLGTGAVSMDNGTTLGFLNSFTFANAVILTNVGDPTIDTGANTDTTSGAITGPGALTKTGSGTLILTGANTYSGGTTISQGTLVGSATSFGTGAIVDDAALVFNQVSNAGFANPISGPGTVTKTGAGLLDLTGASTYTGATTLAQGTLLVDGATSGSVVTAQNGTTLGGFGTVGGIVAQAGATVAPGLAAPYSTLHVNGNVAFQPGSTYRVQVNGTTGATDAITATGTAAITGGTVAAITNGAFTAGRSFTILTAAGGRTGTFNSLSTSSTFAFLTPELVYDPTHVILTFVANGTTPAQIGITPNQQATGTGVPSSVFGLLQGLTVPGARQALDALSGEGHASAETAAVAGARIVGTSILDRLWNIGGATGDAYDVLQGFGAPLPTLLRCYAPGDTTTREILSQYSVWAVGIGDFGHFGGNGNAASLDTTLGGFIGGVDMPVYAGSAIWRFGIAGGYSNDDITVRDRGTSGTFESVFGTLYGGVRVGAFDARFGAGVAGNNTSLQRTVAFPGFNEGEHSSYGGTTVQGFGEIGYRFSFGGGQKVIEPVAGFTAISVHQDGFHEDGGLGALRGFRQDTDVQSSELGFRAEALPFANLPLVARIHLAWQHSFGDLNPASVLAFEAGGSAFQVTGAPIDHDAALIDAGADYRATGALTIGLNYVGTIGPRNEDHSIRGRMEYRF